MQLYYLRNVVDRQVLKIELSKMKSIRLELEINKNLKLNTYNIQCLISISNIAKLSQAKQSFSFG